MTNMARPKKIVVEKNSDNIEKVVASPTGKSNNTKERVRPTRRPDRADRLSAPPREGFHRRWMNDSAGRIAKMQAMGYEIVTENIDMNTSGTGDPSQESTIVRREVGGGMFAILMEIPQEWYDDEKRKEQDKIDQLEDERNTPSEYGVGVTVHKSTKVTTN